MDRTSLVNWWTKAWDEGLWSAPWNKSLEGLTAAQASWKPAPQRNSIWQIVGHMVFWREDALARLTGKSKPTDEEIARSNFPQPGAPNEADWQSLKNRFAESQRRIAAVLADSGANIERLQYMLPHDCYHMGQINYLRAMQGLAAIE